MARKFYQKRRSRAAALVFWLVAAAALILLLGGRVFVVRRIAVSGNQVLTDRDVIGRSGLILGKSIFSVSETKIRRAFERDGQVALKGVAVHYPDTVEISVRERQGCAYVSYLGKVYLVDEYCEVVHQMDELPGDNLPVVTGMSITWAVPGQAMTTSVRGQTEAVYTVLRALSRAGMAQDVAELNVANLDNMYLITRAGMLIELGDEERMETKISWAQSVIPHLEAEGLVKGILDVSSGTSAIYSP